MIFTAGAHSIVVNDETVHTVANAKIRVVELPITGLSVVEDDGEFVFISSNGRFVISGQLTDVWQKRKLTTLAELAELSQRIPIESFDLDITKLNAFRVGHGAKRVVTFVDPFSAASKELVMEAQLLTDHYTFDFIVVPALGDESHQLSLKLFCAADRISQANAFVAGELAALPQQESCNTAAYDETLVTAEILGVNGVPYLVAPDGRFMAGKPFSLERWLEGRL